MIKNIEPGRMIDRLFTDTDPKPKPKRHRNPSPDDIHQFNGLLDMIDHTDNYEVSLQKPVKPTQSVVEVHQPYLAPTDPEEATNTQYFLFGDAEAVQAGVNEVVSQV